MYQVIALKNQKNSGKPDGLACRTIPSKTSTLYCWSSAHVCNISDVFQTSAAVTLHHSTSSLLLLLLYIVSATDTLAITRVADTFTLRGDSLLVKCDEYSEEILDN